MARQHTLVVGVADLLRRPGARREEHLEADLGEVGVTGTIVPSGERVVLDLTLEAVNEGIVVKGTVSAAYASECRRCLAPVQGVLEADVMEIFEAEPVEGETFPLRVDRIDLEPLAREAVLLGLPQNPLCREDCAGLCPECGADRNVEDCGHGGAPVDDRWAALEGLTFDE